METLAVASVSVAVGARLAIVKKYSDSVGN